MPSQRTLSNIHVFMIGAALVALLFAVAIGRAPELASAKRPDIVLIQTDDQTAATLNATYVNKHGQKKKVMENTLDLIGNRGVEFSNYYVSVPVCSPSRATLLSGQYAHTNGLPRNGGKLGGVRGLSSSPIFRENLAVALQRRGYHTAHYGRFTNNYGKKGEYNRKAVPPGWDTWASDWTSGDVRRFYGYSLNINGRIKGPYGSKRFGKYRLKDPVGCPSSKGIECNYHTDVLNKMAIREVKKVKRGPLYIQIDYQAPHDGPPGTQDSEPARRHIGTANRTPLPTPPGFNERDISDKPEVLRRGNQYLDREAVDGIKVRYRRQLESLRSVDEGIGRLVRMLRRTDRLSNTYVFFVSDNGYFLGEHRFGKSKFLAHEPSSNVPLIVRGPGVPTNRTSRAIVGNVDLAPTIADIAGAKLRLEPDGRSFLRNLERPGLTGNRSVMLESYMLPSEALNRHLRESGKTAGRGGATVSGTVPYVNYSALRAGRYKYIKYQGGGRELYDLKADPFELSNKVSSPRYARVVDAIGEELSARRFCAGIECRKAVTGLPDPKPVGKGNGKKNGRN